MLDRRYNRPQVLAKGADCCCIFFLSYIALFPRGSEVSPTVTIAGNAGPIRPGMHFHACHIPGGVLGANGFARHDQCRGSGISLEQLNHGTAST